MTTKTTVGISILTEDGYHAYALSNGSTSGNAAAQAIVGAISNYGGLATNAGYQTYEVDAATPVQIGDQLSQSGNYWTKALT